MTLGAHTVINTLHGDHFVSDLLGHDGAVYAYTWNGQRVTLGKFMICLPTPQVPTRITLDDEADILVARTKVLLREGRMASLSDLKACESLMPLYRRVGRDGYPFYQEPGDWNKGGLTRRDTETWRKSSRLVAEALLGRRCQHGDVIKHKDKNKMNCLPTNLSISHRAPKMRAQKAKFAEPLFEAQRFIDKHNHKIDKIEIALSQEMFSIKGIEASNISVDGIFIAVDEAL